MRSRFTIFFWGSICPDGTRGWIPKNYTKQLTYTHAYAYSTIYNFRFNSTNVCASGKTAPKKTTTLAWVKVHAAHTSTSQSLFKCCWKFLVPFCSSVNSTRLISDNTSSTSIIKHRQAMTEQRRQVLRMCGLHCCLRNWVLQPKIPVPTIFVHGWYVTAWYCLKSCQITRVELQHWDRSQLYLNTWTGCPLRKAFSAVPLLFWGRNWKWQNIPKTWRWLHHKPS